MLCPPAAFFYTWYLGKGREAHREDKAHPAQIVECTNDTINFLKCFQEFLLHILIFLQRNWEKQNQEKGHTSFSITEIFIVSHVRGTRNIDMPLRDKVKNAVRKHIISVTRYEIINSQHYQQYICRNDLQIITFS